MFDELSALRALPRSGCRIFCRGSCRSCSRSTTTGSQYFAKHAFSELLERFTNQSMQLAEMDTYINLSLVAGGDMIYTYDELACSDCRQVYLGRAAAREFPR